MTALFVVALAVLASWFARRTVVLIVPILGLLAYGALVYNGYAGTDTPAVALAVLAELGLASGILARKWNSAPARIDI